MGILKIVLKKWEFSIFYVKNSKKLGIPIFVPKIIEDFWNSHVFFTVATKKVLFGGDFPMKNEVKIFGIPMSSLGGVHLISGIAQWENEKIWTCQWLNLALSFTGRESKKKKKTVNYANVSVTIAKTGFPWSLLNEMPAGFHLVTSLTVTASDQEFKNQLAY